MCIISKLLKPQGLHFIHWPTWTLRTDLRPVHSVTIKNATLGPSPPVVAAEFPRTFREIFSSRCNKSYRVIATTGSNDFTLMNDQQTWDLFRDCTPLKVWVVPKTKSKRRRNGCILSTSTTRECFPPVLQFTVKLLHVYLRRQQLKKQPQIVGAVEKRADSHTRQKKKKKIIRTYIAAHANAHTHVAHFREDPRSALSECYQVGADTAGSRFVCQPTCPLAQADGDSVG